MTKTRILGLLSATTCLLLGGCNSSLFGTSSSVSQTEIVTAARILRLYQGFFRTVISNLTTTPTGTVQYDGNLYYYKALVSGTVTTITYYQDSGGSLSQGTITVTNTTTAGASSQTYSVLLDITGLTRPVENTTAPTATPLVLTIGPGNSPITVSGSFTETSASGNFPMTVSVTNTVGAITGSVSGTVFGTAVTFTNLTGTTTGLNAYTLSGTGTVGTSTETFNESINADGSGTATVSDGTALQWNSGGNATLVTPNAGGNINIANVDGGQ
jgi:hypothetical protein